jgi:ribosome-binding factor A
MQPELAKAACQGIRDKALLQDCIFDVTVMGDRSVARGYITLDRLRTPNVTAAQPQ